MDPVGIFKIALHVEADGGSEAWKDNQLCTREKVAALVAAKKRVQKNWWWELSREDAEAIESYLILAEVVM
jgi:hypothetical protein